MIFGKPSESSEIGFGTFGLARRFVGE